MDVLCLMVFVALVPYLPHGSIGARGMISSTMGEEVLCSHHEKGIIDYILTRISTLAARILWKRLQSGNAKARPCPSSTIPKLSWPTPKLAAT